MLIISFITTNAVLRSYRNCSQTASVINQWYQYIQYWHNFRAKKEHNFQKIDQIFYEYAHLNIMSILLQNIKKNRTHKVTNYYLKNN